MTKRSELQHRVLELKESILSRVANKLFTFKQTGMDGFIKRRMLKPKAKTLVASIPRSRSKNNSR